MIEAKNNRELIEAVKKAERNTLIFFDEGGSDIKYGKSKFMLELCKILDKKATADNNDFKTAKPKLKQ